MDALLKLTRAELVVEAESRGLPTSGTKTDLAEAIVDHDNATPLHEGPERYYPGIGVLNDGDPIRAAHTQE